MVKQMVEQMGGMPGVIQARLVEAVGEPIMYQRINEYPGDKRAVPRRLSHGDEHHAAVRVCLRGYQGLAQGN